MAGAQDTPQGSSIILPDDPPVKEGSAVWKFFDLPAGQKRVSGRYVTCNICNKRLSRGTAKQYSFGTSSQWKHLRTMHPRNYASLKRQVDESQQITSAVGDSTQRNPAQAVSLSQTSAVPSSSVTQTGQSALFSAPDESDIFAVFVAHCRKCQQPLGFSETTYSGFTQCVRTHTC